MGLDLKQLKGWHVHIKEWRKERHVKRFYITRRRFEMFFINIPKYKYITIYKVK